MTQTFYPGILGRANDGAVGVVFADFPGCVSVGETTQEAATNGVEALDLHVEGLLADGDALPEPSALGLVPDWLEAERDTILGHCLVPVEIPSKAMRLNITMDEGFGAPAGCGSGGGGVHTVGISGAGGEGADAAGPVN
jgi:predicted RNase H-like HicB family nuclease